VHACGYWLRFRILGIHRWRKQDFSRRGGGLEN